jgi:hypothetical protein
LTPSRLSASSASARRCSALRRVTVIGGRRPAIAPRRTSLGGQKSLATLRILSSSNLRRSTRFAPFGEDTHQTLVQVAGRLTVETPR